MTTAVVFEEVSKDFGSVRAVENVEMEILDGEFFSMLGPSGSGKTTCLRMIAGFEQPTVGRILLHGQDVTGQAPYERDVNTVFQDYALFPHMNVAENVAYGLMVKGVEGRERAERVAEALDLVRLGGFGERRPSQLSGGQRQRVALARALINRPSVLLLDEPLGALDLKLRQAMQIELKSLHREVGITFVFVTHDQEEALTMSDRMAVFSHGRVEQIGTPAEVYESPRNSFVAGFVGTSNLITGELAASIRGSSRAFTVRPEKIRLTSRDRMPGADEVTVDGTVKEALYLGMYSRYQVEVEDTLLEVASQNLEIGHRDLGEMVGRAVRLSWSKDSCRPLADAEQEEVTTEEETPE